MALVVEDGSNVQSSNSFASEQELIDFASLRGVSISSSEVAAVNLIKAMDLLSTYESELKGSRTNPTQNLMFPRKGVRIYATDTEDFADDKIPACVKLAQLHAAIYAFEGTTLLPVQQNGAVLIRKKTAVLEKEWAYNPDATTVPTLPLVDSSLAPVLAADATTGYLTVYRA